MAPPPPKMSLLAPAVLAPCPPGLDGPPAPIHRDYTLQGLLARVQVQLQLWAHSIHLRQVLLSRTARLFTTTTPPPSHHLFGRFRLALSHTSSTLSLRHLGHLVRPSSVPLIPSSSLHQLSPPVRLESRTFHLYALLAYCGSSKYPHFASTRIARYIVQGHIALRARITFRSSTSSSIVFRRRVLCTKLLFSHSLIGHLVTRFARILLPLKSGGLCSKFSLSSQALRRLLLSIRLQIP